MSTTPDPAVVDWVPLAGSLVPGRLGSPIGQVTDFNKATETGYYSTIQDPANKPPASGRSWQIQVIRSVGGDTATPNTNVFICQIARGLENVDDYWIRWYSYSSWNSWFNMGLPLRLGPITYLRTYATDWNLAKPQGFYYGDDSSLNRPGLQAGSQTGIMFGITCTYWAGGSDYTGNGDGVRQILFPRSGSGQVWTRWCNSSNVWSTWQWWGVPQMVTSISGISFDGQEILLTDSLTAPTYTWQLKYNAASTNTNKWEYIGGTPAFVAVEASEAWSGTVGTPTDLATVGPQFTVPRSGDYMVELWCRVDAGAQTGWDCASMHLVDNNNAGTSPTIQCLGNVYLSPTTVPYVALNAAGIVPVVSGHVLKAKYMILAQDAAGSINFAQRRMRITPVRLS